MWIFLTSGAPNDKLEIKIDETNEDVGLLSAKAAEMTTNK